MQYTSKSTNRKLQENNIGGNNLQNANLKTTCGENTTGNTHREIKIGIIQVAKIHSEIIFGTYTLEKYKSLNTNWEIQIEKTNVKMKRNNTNREIQIRQYKSETYTSEIQTGNQISETANRKIGQCTSEITSRKNTSREL